MPLLAVFLGSCPIFGIVQKVFSEKASAIARMRQKCVRNASKMRHKCVTNASQMHHNLLGKEERSKMRQKCVKIASKMHQKCAEHLWGRTPFGWYRYLYLWKSLNLVVSGPSSSHKSIRNPNHMSNRIFMRTRQKQMCATFCRKHPERRKLTSLDLVRRRLLN